MHDLASWATSTTNPSWSGYYECNGSCRNIGSHDTSMGAATPCKPFSSPTWEDMSSITALATCSNNNTCWVHQRDLRQPVHDTMCNVVVDVLRSIGQCLCRTAGPVAVDAAQEGNMQAQEARIPAFHTAVLHRGSFTCSAHDLIAIFGPTSTTCSASSMFSILVKKWLSNSW